MCNTAGMKIGILSDTHDKQSGITQALEIFSAENVEAIIHCGDWTHASAVEYILGWAWTAHMAVYGVWGNNDTELTELTRAADSYEYATIRDGVLQLELDGVKISAYHGHHKPTRKQVLESSNDLILIGHSHKPFLETAEGRTIINPGSTAFAIPRSKTWRGSVALYDTKRREAEIMYFEA